MTQIAKHIYDTLDSYCNSLLQYDKMAQDAECQTSIFTEREALESKAAECRETIAMLRGLLKTYNAEMGFVEK